MNATELWNKLQDLFDPDEGSLPEICLTNLSGPEVERAFGLLWSLGKNVTKGGGTFRDKQRYEDRPVESVENAAALVVQGIAEPFHVVLGGITLHGATIPDLGMLVCADGIYFDYRKGGAWGPAELNALFACFCRIQAIVPGLQVALWDMFPAEPQRLFREVWQEYLREASARL